MLSWGNKAVVMLPTPLLVRVLKLSSKLLVQDKRWWRAIAAQLMLNLWTIQLVLSGFLNQTGSGILPMHPILPGWLQAAFIILPIRRPGQRHQ